MTRELPRGDSGTVEVPLSPADSPELQFQEWSPVLGWLFCDTTLVEFFLLPVVTPSTLPLVTLNKNSLVGHGGICWNHLLWSIMISSQGE